MVKITITEVRVGDRVSAVRSGFRTVTDVRVSYTASGADCVTVEFADGGAWRSYPADTKVYAK